MEFATRMPAERFSGSAEIRRRFLTTVMLATTVWGIGIVLATAMGLLPFERLQAANNFGFSLLNIALLLGLRRFPGRATAFAAIYLTASYYLVVCALFQVPQDQLRMLLFFPALGAVFLLLGSAAGWFAMSVSVIAFGLAFRTGYVDVTPLAASTFVLTLGLTALFFHAFRTQAMRALDIISGQNAALDAAARRDPLTGLLNLRAFREITAGMARERAVTSYAVAFIDVDHFKSVNDRFGHAGGDAVLGSVAQALRLAVRPQDSIARIGGEEFAVLMPGVDATTALGLCERLRTAVEGTRVTVSAAQLSVTVSIGLAVSNDAAHSADALLLHADAAMYRAKNEGRNRVATASAL
ncbi:MAG: GGDEF domain-containing protein [Pseudomonadota bacterium]